MKMILLHQCSERVFNSLIKDGYLKNTFKDVILSQNTQSRKIYLYYLTEQAVQFLKASNHVNIKTDYRPNTFSDQMLAHDLYLQAYLLNNKELRVQQPLIYCLRIRMTQISQHMLTHSSNMLKIVFAQFSRLGCLQASF